MASISKRKGKRGVSYYVTIRRRGHPPIYEAFKKLDEAKAFVSRTEGNISEGKHYGLARVRTLADLLDEYEKEAPAIKTAGDRKTALNWWRENYGKVLLRDLDAGMLVKAKRQIATEKVKRHVHAKVEPQPRSASTTRRYLIALGQALKHGAVVLRWIPANPMADVAKPTAAPGRVRWLSEDERTKLMKACKASDNPDLFAMVLIALSSGARQNEVRTLRWKQIDLAQKVAWLSTDDTKTAHARAVPLVPSVIELLAERAKVRRIDTDLLFPSPSRPKQPRNFRQAFAGALKRAGITGFRFHDLRHSAATEMLRSGIDSRVVSEILGHRSLQMAQRYQHVLTDHLVEAATHAAKRAGI